MPPTGPSCCRAGLGLVVIEDKSDTWAHGIDAFRNEIGRPEFVSSAIVEDGPVTRVTRQHLTWRSSTITVEIAEFAGIDAVEFRFVIDWHEHEQILKFEVPCKLPQPAVFAKVPGAVLQRAASGNEEPYQDWVALEGKVHGEPYTAGADEPVALQLRLQGRSAAHHPDPFRAVRAAQS